MTVTKINVIGKIWNVKYNVDGGYFSSLGEMLKYFKVVSNEICVFKIEVSNVMYVRIYQKDGT